MAIQTTVCFVLKVDKECGNRLSLLSKALGDFEQSDIRLTDVDCWLADAECQLRILQRSAGDLKQFQQQTDKLKVSFRLHLAKILVDGNTTVLFYSRARLK